MNLIDPVIRAVADTLRDYPQGWCGDHDECLLGMAEAVVLVARPLIQEQLVEASTSGTWIDDEYMCPNCVTPWKCNGPHLLEP